MAAQYGVDNLLAPLFNYQAPSGRMDKTPTKEQVLALTRKSSTKPMSKKGRDSTDFYKDGSVYPEPKRKKSMAEPIYSHMDSSQTLVDVMDMPHLDENRHMMGYQMNNYYMPNDPMHYYGIHTPHLAQIPMMHEPPTERHRSTIMAIFMNDDDSFVPDILLPHTTLPSDFDIDLILDEHGHNALHWAAA